MQMKPLLPVLVQGDNPVFKIQLLKNTLPFAISDVDRITAVVTSLDRSKQLIPDITVDMFNPLNDLEHSLFHLTIPRTHTDLITKHQLATLEIEVVSGSTMTWFFKIKLSKATLLDFYVPVHNLNPLAPFSYLEGALETDILAVASVENIGTGVTYAIDVATDPNGFYEIAANGQISLSTAGAAGDANTYAGQTEFNLGIIAYNIDNEPSDTVVQSFTVLPIVPIITLLGDNPQTIELGAGYTDLGAVSDLGTPIVHDSSNYDDSVGSYAVVYGTTSASGVPATNVWRVVHVEDTVVPTLPSTGTGTYEEFRVEGEVIHTVTATDFGALTYTINPANPAYQINGLGEVSLTALGVTGDENRVAGSSFFQLGIHVTDASGNLATQALSLTVIHVIDITPPVMVPIDPAGITYEEGRLDNDVLFIASATDNVGVDHYVITNDPTNQYEISSIGNVSLSATGVTGSANIYDGVNNYAIYIAAVDIVGNTSPSEILNTTITQAPDTEIPVVNPITPVSYVEGQTLTDVLAVATATDNFGVTGFTLTDSNFFFTINNQGEVTLTVLGLTSSSNVFDGTNIHTVAITAVDAAGNVSLPVNLSLTVTQAADTEKPVIIPTPLAQYIEGASAGDVLAVVQATDNFAVTHFTMLINTVDYYAINSIGEVSITASGVASTANTFAGQTAFTIQVQAHDAAGNTSLASTVNLEVIEIGDVIPPVITLTGANPQTVEFNTPYVELGATTDDGSPIVISNFTDTGTVGAYAVLYNSTDVSGNVALQVTRTVNVTDTIAPVITLTGANPQILEQGTGYTELGATTDDGSPIVINSSGYTDAVGNYSILYDSFDGYNNAIQVARTVNVIDTIAPVITLLGSNPQTREYTQGYAELGATTDDGSAVTIDSSAYIDFVGSYNILYDSVDVYGNQAVQVVRQVNVTDTVAPVITLTGSNPQAIELGAGYTELGATTDDGTAVTIDSSAFQDVIGSYNVLYDSFDGYNNAIRVTRQVNVGDTTAPVITLIGSNPQVIELGTGYVELGATTDDGSAVVIDSSAFIDAVGAYNVLYDSVDGNGNNATQVVRQVQVTDTVAPIISLNGNASYTIELGSPYAELGATTDDGSPVVIDDSNYVDVVGDYVILYNSTDASGNVAVEVTRSIAVRDTVAPVITLSGANPQVIARGQGYTELGATTDDGSPIVIDSSNFQDIVGSYFIYYNSFDGYNNAIQKVRTVNVVDVIPPVITLNGSNPQPRELGQGYVELGATTDDGSPIVINSSAYVDLIGSYNVTYNSTDPYGNVAIEVVRVVEVSDTTAPSMQAKGAQEYLEGRALGEVIATVSAVDNDSIASYLVVSGSDNFVADSLGNIYFTSLGISSVYNDASTGSNSAVITLTATDPSGNVSVDRAYVLDVLPAAAPIVKTDTSFIRSSKASSYDYNYLRTSMPYNELRMSGYRRVKNDMPIPVVGDWSVSSGANVIMITDTKSRLYLDDGAAAYLEGAISYEEFDKIVMSFNARLLIGTGSGVSFGDISGRTDIHLTGFGGLLNTTDKRFVTATSNMTSSGRFGLYIINNSGGDVTIDITDVQIERGTLGATANSYELQTEGVKYYPSTNGNSVSTGILLVENAGTNLSNLGGIMIESALTNDVTDVGELTTWTSQNVAVFQDAKVSPTGDDSAWILRPTAVSSYHLISDYFASSPVAGATTVVSAYFKEATIGYNVRFVAGVISDNTDHYLDLNLNSLTVSNVTNLDDYSITPAGNGWYKVEMSLTFAASGTHLYLQIQVLSGTSSTFAGDNVKHILAWFPQSVAGTYGGLPIKTFTVPVTKEGDNLEYIYPSIPITFSVLLTRFVPLRDTFNTGQPIWTTGDLRGSGYRVIAYIDVGYGVGYQSQGGLQISLDRADFVKGQVYKIGVSVHQDGVTSRIVIVVDGVQKHVNTSTHTLDHSAKGTLNIGNNSNASNFIDATFGDETDIVVYDGVVDLIPLTS